MGALTLQVKYNCMSCKEAKHINGNGCKCGDLFPILLAMAGEDVCPNFEYDLIKADLRDLERTLNEQY